MSSELLAVLIGGGIGVIGSIVGAFVNHWLSLRADEIQRERNRIEEERRRQREQEELKAAEIRAKLLASPQELEAVEARAKLGGRILREKGGFYQPGYSVVGETSDVPEDEQEARKE